MPATEETYRSQPILHLVFAITSVAMLLSIVWMIVADHFRPWKEVQREFQKVEREKLEAAKKEKLEEQQAEVPGPDRRDRREDQGRPRPAPTSGPASSARSIGSCDKLGGEVRAARHAAAVQEGRARQQAQPLRRHDRPGRRGRGQGLPRPTSSSGAEQELDDLSKELEAAEDELKTDRRPARRSCSATSTNLKKEQERLTREADRVERAIEQKDALYGGPVHWYSKPMAFLRGLPGVDLMPPTKIQQISLPELTINYNFKEVPRYDRCTTCHQGIDRIGYDKDAERQARCPRSSPPTRT